MREETNNHQAIQKHFGEHSLKNQINEVTDPPHCQQQLAITIKHHLLAIRHSKHATKTAAATTTTESQIYVTNHKLEHSLKNQINEVTDPLHCHTTISHHYQTSFSGNPTFQARNKNSSNNNNNNRVHGSM